MDFSCLKQEWYYTHNLWRLLSPTNISGVRQPILLFERSLKLKNNNNGETLVLCYLCTHPHNYIESLILMPKKLEELEFLIELNSFHNFK